MTYDYNKIQASIERVLDAVQDDHDLMVILRADPAIISQLKTDIQSLKEAAEVVKRYQELES
jgi:hypothetical protein